MWFPYKQDYSRLNVPYTKGTRLPGERASKLGHLQVVNSPLVNKLVDEFTSTEIRENRQAVKWEELNPTADTLPIVFGVDGSQQVINENKPPYKSIMFVKTAILKMDFYKLSKLDKDAPNPFALRDMLKDSAVFHSTVFPLRNVRIADMSTYHTIRHVVYDSLKDDLDGSVLETLKWIAYEKWQNEKKSLQIFECPHCRKTVASLEYNELEGICTSCKEHIYITDMLGFHQEMVEDAASQNVPSTYRSIHETLLLFTGIRYFWEHEKHNLPKCLFVKDGPLSLRAQYSKLVNPIRRFIKFAKDKGIEVHILGQEKTGNFVDHLHMISNSAPNTKIRIFIPSSDYIKKEIQNRPLDGADYGKDTNYAAKVFVLVGNYHKLVLNIPTYVFQASPSYSDLIGADRIFSSLPGILGNKYEDSLLPVELANGIASLSTYPSSTILKLFAESKGII